LRAGVPRRALSRQRPGESSDDSRRWRNRARQFRDESETQQSSWLFVSALSDLRYDEEGNDNRGRSPDREIEMRGRDGAGLFQVRGFGSR
jgi:hypothetical protein